MSDFGQMDQMDFSCHWILDKTTGGLKFSGLGLDRTKLGPDSAPGQIWDQFLKSFDGKKSETHAQVYNKGMFWLHNSVKITRDTWCQKKK